jgi:hypothetical protein
MHLIAEFGCFVHDGLDPVVHGYFQKPHIFVHASLHGPTCPDLLFTCHAVFKGLLLPLLLQSLQTDDLLPQLLHLLHNLHVFLHGHRGEGLRFMVPCLVAASATRAYTRVRVEAAARAPLAPAIAIGLGHDEAALAAGELGLVARNGLPKAVDEGVRLAMVHQESSGSGGRGAGRAIGGSWKAGGELCGGTSAGKE